MAIQRVEAGEILLNALRRDQDRLVFIMSMGFVVGFILGAIGAWALISLH